MTAHLIVAVECRQIITDVKFVNAFHVHQLSVLLLVKTGSSLAMMDAQAVNVTMVRLYEVWYLARTYIAMMHLMNILCKIKQKTNVRL